MAKKGKYDSSPSDMRKPHWPSIFATDGPRLTYVSLFSGAGVGCYGFKEAGFRCVATAELLPGRLAVQRANDKCDLDSGYICGDITQADVKRRIIGEVDRWRDYRHAADIDVVFATPPCQGMSTVNYKKADNEQVRNSLVVEAIKLILEIHPKVFVIENVRAFMSTICTDIDGTDRTIAQSIERNLSSDYHIYHKVINFMDYGVPSSRPRTLVIGTLKSLRNISPLNLFPTRSAQISLREAIGDLPSLRYGERDSNDLYHFARRYPEYQERWIEKLAEGESAFRQSAAERHPYKIDAEGKRIPLKGAYMGNKYRRLFWDKPCACVATRNDQLASQDTIHPSDNRVLSIRELMRVMTIPDSFRWTSRDGDVPIADGDAFMAEYELNIRRCIGEAVPTSIVRQVADKIAEMLQFEDFVDAFKEGQTHDYDDSPLLDNFYIDTFLKEQAINDAKRTGAFYTPQCVVFDALRSVVARRDKVRILEPAVGLGSFLPQLAALFSDAESVEIDAVEIDAATIEQLRESISKINLGCNVRINYIHADFLKLSLDRHYDLIAANPPYVKASQPYPELSAVGHKTKNLFALFLLKFIGVADEIACIIPKNFVIADEYFSVRKAMEGLPIVRICDFGVKYFKKVFIEIISINFRAGYADPTEVVDYVNGDVMHQPQGYIYHEKLWTIYRDEQFDEFFTSIIPDVFTFFRDRQITNRYLSDSGEVRVLRSRNILDDGSIVSIPGYDRYTSDPERFAVARYLDSEAIIMPNFTYLTRATILPPNTLPNGSIAVLLPKNIDKEDVDLAFYATEGFRKYYSIVKSKSRFTLNIDNCSIYYIGIKKK